MKTVFGERHRLQAGRAEPILSRGREIGLGEVIVSERAVCALCRPPGHHAARDCCGGYCFLNNAAIAAQSLCDRAAAGVAVLDIDYHHGNGTQAIFYNRADVLFLALHADPRQEFPFFLSHAGEIGAAAGEGFNRNYLRRRVTGFALWSVALENACQQIGDYQPDALVVSLGVDIFKDGAIACFGLESEDFLAVGARIARLGLPTLFVMEVAYAIAALGITAVNVLSGSERAA